MITDLSVVTTASFFLRKKRVTNADINDLLGKVRSAHKTTTRNLFKHAREKCSKSLWSAICFKYESTPAFLVPATTVREELCGYLMLVEYSGYIAVFSSRLSLTSSFKSDFLTNIPAAQLEAAIAKQDAVFQKMRLRNMSLSQYAMRTKTLEAADLANVVGPAGSRRYAPQGYTVELDGVSTTATPSTGRIAVRSDKVGYDGLVEFAEKVIDELSANAANVSPFIKTFARPMTLEEALKQSQPVTLGIETSTLIDAVAGDHAPVRLVRDLAGNITPVSDADLAKLIQGLERSFEISGGGKMRDVRVPNGGDKVASISLNKGRIALRSLILPEADSMMIEDSTFAIGTDPNPRSLREFLDYINAIIVLFDDIRLAYIGGAVFRDETLVDGGEDFLRYLHEEPSLAAAKGEKKRRKFKSTQKTFDADSTFGSIVNAIAAKDDLLICDDLGDEWADFIGVKTDSGVTFVSFYHGKHGKLSLGASAFHVSVGQAIKNLGNMTFPSERIAGKVVGWSKDYVSDNGPTQIPRIVRGNAVTLAADLARTRAAPDTVRRAVIVTSSLSKKAVADALVKAKKGKAPKPSFVQLYWLLQSFFSACAEVGATGSIVCRP